MIWATWRGQRLLWLVALAGVAAFAVWLAVTGSMQESAWGIYASHHCLSGAGSSGTCLLLADRYDNASHFSTVNVGLAIAVPAIVGLVLGVPMVAREIEQGTNRLAWTQSITRTRWLLIKLGVGALVCAVLVGALVPVLDWWTGAVQRGPHIEPWNFDFSGFADVAYVLFAFMLGAALGALIRRTGWAFAVGLPLYALARIIVRSDIRSHLLPLSVLSVAPRPATAGASYSDAGWTIQSGYVALGRTSPAPGQTWQSGVDLIDNCTQKFLAYTQKDANRSIVQNKLHLVVQYQPAGHFWALQGVESSIFVGLALVLFAVTVLAVQRWRT